MRKRILAMLLSFVVIVSMMAFPASAATTDKGTALTEKITTTFKYLRKLNGNKSFHGYCGRLAGYTLYALGINKYATIYNGKDTFNAYNKMDVTSNGYKVETYPATKYNLEEALLAATDGGTRDVYNLMVGFQWTNTDAGRKYGHSVALYGVLDGMVYFTESFKIMGKEEGKPVVCSIKEFADSYNKWTRFEGLVTFGTKTYADFCNYYPTNLFATTTEQVDMVSIPSGTDVGEEKVTVLQSILPNERLTVVGVYENDEGKYFYETTYNGITGYVDATKAQTIRLNTDKVTISDIKVPKVLKKGKGFTVEGTIQTWEGSISNICTAITDMDGKVLYTYTMNKGGKLASISAAAAKAMKFSRLSEGVYTFIATCDLVNYYVENGQLLPVVTTVTMTETVFTVGNAVATEPTPPVDEPATEIPDGWNYDAVDGKWKYYRDGALTYGWVFTPNAIYYILEDGTAATGSMEINGEMRYFTPTGAMRTGWFTTEAGQMYLLRNGATAFGWQEIDGQHCYFDANGIYDSGAVYYPTGEDMVEESIFVSIVELLQNILFFGQ